ncbi:MAG: LamG-like jellyroll fold domain-containing protein, partial [Candidatus Cyclobacteriaceae bacterium M3_2C_046]
MKLRNIPFRKQQPKFNCCTSIRSILPVKSLLISHAFILLFITIGVIELYAAPPSPLLLETGFDCNSDGKLKVSFLSTLIDNSQDDSWSDDTSPGVILKVNGTIVFEGNYGLDSHSNGSLSSHKKADGVTFSEVAGPQIDGNSTKKVVVIVPLSYLSSGSNDINLSGTWKERVESGSDKNTPIDETKQESITLPEAPTGASSSIDADGKVTLTWSNPSGDYTGIKIYRNGSEKATITDGKSSWTDPTANMNQESYGILAYADHPSCTGKFSFSSEAAVQAPAPPKVSKPAGLTASTGRCDGKILVSWDYNGDVEPTSFILSIGGTDKTLNGDLREYLDETVGTHTTRSYTIKAKGPINTSDATTAVSGSTSGPPDQPGSISANGYVSQNRIYIDWGNSDHHNKYLLIRNSSSGSSEFEISKTQSNFNDNTVNGCEMYTYEVYASNACTEAEGIAGIKASGTASERLEPNLSSYLTFFDASKAYYPDKVVLEWEVQNNNLAMVDAFEVLRRKAGTGSYSVVGTVSGEAYFEDKTALGGTLYEYQLKSRLDCDNKNISSNTLYAVGFRIPYGIVNGNISYENGVNVKGVDVMADKGNEPIGRSLSFGGSGKVTVTNDGQLNPANNLAVEAWIRPSSTSGSPAIISKFDGSRGYKLYHENSDVVFTANINGGLQTVRAQNVLKLNEYTHVSGVYEGNTLKIFIDGKVPVDVSYQVDQEELDYLALSGVTTEVISLLEPMKGTNYTDPVLFTNQLINLLDSGLALSINPILMPMAKIVEYQPGTVITGISGSVTHTTGSLFIGDGFRGNIDEIRIWNKARDEERVFYDYKRIVGNDENGLAAYWRCEENFGTYIYDVSKSGGEFHKNDGTFSGVTWSSEIPNRYQLGWMGKTDANGDYTIPYVPYFGSGENFTITPIYEQHQFELKSKTVFLGEGSTILSEQNFTDISSFKVTGTVFYQDTYCGVEGAIVGIDGEPVIKNGKPIYTDQFGKFEIAVPVGEHFVYVQKSGHEFISHKFPPGPETATFNFQEPINGINFVDKTKVTVVGRVVGGTIEGDKKPGLGLSVNNIGVAEFRFECATCEGQWAVTTDAATGEFRAELPPMKYLINKGDFIYKNPAVGIYFSSLPEADFSLVNPKTLVTHTYSGVVDMKIEIDSVQRQATLDIDGITDPVVIEN